MRMKGSFNRSTGKTTRRNKAKTHWAKKGREGRSTQPRKSAKGATSGSSKASN